ncbi:MAG: tetratricopeptide repeat protein [Chloroflexi bacterium]|nr:tetratricopeptide repeat protein [Chloroflexota bacterium]
MTHTLGRLVSKSLVQVERWGDEVRHRLLETVREFAAERLRACGEDVELRTRHREWYLQMAASASEHLQRPGEDVWLDHLDAELENIKLAFAWCGTDGDLSLEAGLRTSGRMWWFWYVRYHWSEAQAVLQRLLSSAGSGVDSGARAEAMYAHAFLLRNQGNLIQARSVQEECLAMRRVVGDRSGMSHTLGELGRITRELGEYATAREMLMEALHLQKELEDRWGIGRQYNALGVIARLQRNFVEAQALFEESLAISRAFGDRIGTGVELAELASVADARGDLPRTRALLLEAMATVRAEHESWMTYLPNWLEHLASVICRMGSAHEAAELFGAAERLRTYLGDSTRYWSASRRERRARRIRMLHLQLADAVFDDAWRAGTDLTLEQTFDLAIRAGQTGSHSHRNGTAARQVLTLREREVARLIARGRSNEQIAAKLVISWSTAAKHVENIRAKLEVPTRTHIAAWVVAGGLEDQIRIEP